MIVVISPARTFARPPALGAKSSSSPPERTTALIAGQSSSSPPERTTALIAGQSTGSKPSRAQSLGLKIMDEKQFLALLDSRENNAGKREV